MFQPVSAKPDFVAQEHELLARWRERRTFARLRAQNAGGPALELPRRADHGQQPDGRPPRLGPDVQGRLLPLPRDARRGPALAERLRLPGAVGRGQRRARPGLHEQARHRGVRHRRVRLALQAARPDATPRARPSSRSGWAYGWTGTTPTSCAGCATCSPRTRPRPRRSRARTARSPTPSRCSSGGWGCRTSAAATSRSATRTTTSSGASSPSATSAAGSTRATTRCRGARAAGRACRRWR